MHRGDKTMIMTRFLQDEQGQDLIEYTLLLAFVCLASAALFISVGGSVGGSGRQPIQISQPQTPPLPAKPLRTQIVLRADELRRPDELVQPHR
jgi:Flp pilus assembly pilin Flp